MSFAEKTTVPVSKSQLEIKELVTRAGAQKYGVMEDGQHAAVVFVLHGRALRFTITLPDPADKAFARDGRGSTRSPQARQAAYDQECRRLWRSLALGIKAKLECVASRITTFESEFLAHIVTSNGRTFGENVIPQLEQHILQPTQVFAQLGPGAA